jgi:hypothetical protein
VDTQLDEGASPAETGQPDGPGPRVTRNLAEQQRRDRRRRRLAVVAALAVVALLGAGAWAVLHGDDETDAGPRVGTLIGSSKGKGAATTTTPAGAPAGSNGQALASEPRWPSVIQGRPQAFGARNDPPPADVGDLEDGFYLWQDFDGWHLWMVGGGPDDRVSVAADDAFAKSEAVGGGPELAPVANGFTLARGGAGAKVVGVDFNPGYYAKTLVVTVDGDLRLRVGAHRAAVGSFYGIQFSAAST